MENDKQPETIVWPEGCEVRRIYMDNTGDNFKIMEGNGVEIGRVTKRSTRGQSETVLGKEFHVLDHGEIRLLDYMGTDEDIARAAWISTGKNDKENVTVAELNRIIRYMLQNGHTSPFEMCELKFYIQLPIFVARQLVRHRTASLNEFSGRYSVMPDLFYCPSKERLGAPDAVNKQGTGEPLDERATELITAMMKVDQTMSRTKYEQYIEMGLSNELARLNLPLSQYSRWIWKIDLHNLMRTLKLRNDSHAQYEIRVYAEILEHIANQCFPIAMAAYNDFLMDSVSVSYDERFVISSWNNGDFNELKRIYFGKMLKGERQRCLVSLKSLGFSGLIEWLNDQPENGQMSNGTPVA